MGLVALLCHQVGCHCRDCGEVQLVLGAGFTFYPAARELDTYKERQAALQYLVTSQAWSTEVPGNNSEWSDAGATTTYSDIMSTILWRPAFGFHFSLPFSFSFFLFCFKAILFFVFSPCFLNLPLHTTFLAVFDDAHWRSSLDTTGPLGRIGNELDMPFCRSSSPLL